MLYDLGKPDVSLGPLKIWVHGLENPESDDYWDGNWLRATAICSDRGSTVSVSGSILRSDELRDWVDSLAGMNVRVSGDAKLICVEPELKVEMVCSSLGVISVKVEITPDNLKQFHSFEFEIDQSYLPGVIAELKTVLTRFEVKGKP